MRLDSQIQSSYHEQLTIPQQCFMNRENVARLAAAFGKVHAHLDELRGRGSARGSQKL